MELNKYTLEQLQGLQLLVAIGNIEYQITNGELSSHAQFWADEITQAIKDAEFEHKKLPY